MSTVITDPSIPEGRRQQAEKILAPHKDVDPASRQEVLDFIANKPGVGWSEAYRTIRNLNVDQPTKAALWDVWSKPDPYVTRPLGGSPNAGRWSTTPRPTTPMPAVP